MSLSTSITFYWPDHKDLTSISKEEEAFLQPLIFHLYLMFVSEYEMVNGVA